MKIQNKVKNEQRFESAEKSVLFLLFKSYLIEFFMSL